MIRVRMSDTRQLDVHWDIDREEWSLTARGLDPLDLVELLISRNSSVRLARHLRHAADLIDSALTADWDAQRTGRVHNGIPTDAIGGDPP